MPRIIACPSLYCVSLPIPVITAWDMGLIMHARSWGSVLACSCRQTEVHRAIWAIAATYTRHSRDTLLGRGMYLALHRGDLGENG